MVSQDGADAHPSTASAAPVLPVRRSGGTVGGWPVRRRSATASG